MDINDLNKTQLILIALLLSFVTSIATGIVTVSLMEQAPPGVTQTINRVVEKTVQVVEPQKEAQIITEQTVIRESDMVADAIKKNQPGYVSLYTKTSEAVKEEIASGFVVNSDGLAATTDSVVAAYNDTNVFAEYGGKEYNTQLVSFDLERYVVIVRLVDPENVDESSNGNFKPVSLRENPVISLGKTVVAVDTTNDTSIGAGMVTRIEMEDTSSEDTGDEKNTEEMRIRYIHTSVEMDKSVEGGPLMLVDGSIVGVNFVSNEGAILATPITAVDKMLRSISQEGLEASIQKSEQMASTISFDQGESGEEKSTNSEQEEAIDASGE